MTVTVQVANNLATVGGLDPLQLNDLYVEAPEPGDPGLGGLSAVSANLLYLFEKLPGAIWQDPGNRLMEARAHRFISKLDRPKPGLYEEGFGFKMPPKPHQLEIFAAAKDMPVIAMAPCAPGTGKTKMTIDICAHKFLQGEIDGVAVIAAPKGVPRQWVEEAIPEHMPPAVRVLARQWKSTRITDKRLLSKHERKMRWLTFNVEAFSSDSGKAAKDLKAFLESGRMALVWDESSRGKNPRAARTKAILKLAKLATVRMILTGTPLTKGMEDLYTQYEFLDPAIIGMSNYYAFRGRYCVTVPAYRGAGVGAVKIVGYRNTEEFVRKIAKVTFVVPKDVLGLPPKTYERLQVELTREQKMAYNAIRNKLVEDLEDLRIANPVNGAVRMIRLQQVLCGRVYEQGDDLEEPPVARSIPSNRISTLTEYIEDNPDTNVIWARFTADILEIEAALKAMGRKPVVVYGAISDDERHEAKVKFMRGEATDFVANPGAAGMGLDGLQRACQRAIFYSNSYNREHRWQAEDRIHRLGMCGTSLNIDLVAGKNTVDHLILESFKKTEELVASILAHPELVPILGEED